LGPGAGSTGPGRTGSLGFHEFRYCPFRPRAPWISPVPRETIPGGKEALKRAIVGTLGLAAVLVAATAGLLVLRSLAGRARLTGRVARGQSLRQPFGPGFTFALHSIESGWAIGIYDRRQVVDISRLTPPFHFVPNPRSIEGWHLRNAANTGPNEAGPGNVNAPGLVREFWFSPSVSAETPTTQEEVENAMAFGAAGSGSWNTPSRTWCPGNRPPSDPFATKWTSGGPPEEGVGFGPSKASELIVGYSRRWPAQWTAPRGDGLPGDEKPATTTSTSVGSVLEDAAQSGNRRVQRGLSTSPLAP